MHKVLGSISQAVHVFEKLQETSLRSREIAVSSTQLKALRLRPKTVRARARDTDVVFVV